MHPLEGWFGCSAPVLIFGERVPDFWSWAVQRRWPQCACATAGLAATPGAPAAEQARKRPSTRDRLPRTAHPKLPTSRPLPACSFRDPVRYELGGRGLVVVTGQVHETAEAGKPCACAGWGKLSASQPEDGLCGPAGAAGTRAGSAAGTALPFACTLLLFISCYGMLSTPGTCHSASLAPNAHAPCPGVESNGAGKTALVMAPLWALTGSVDARAEVRGALRVCWLGGGGAVVLLPLRLVDARWVGRLCGWPLIAPGRLPGPVLPWVLAKACCACLTQPTLPALPSLPRRAAARRGPCCPT